MQNRGRNTFDKFSIILWVITKIFMVFPYKLRVFLFRRARMVQGFIGLGFRYCLLKSISKSVGDNVSIHPGVYIFNTKELIIGNNVSLHPMSYLECIGGITIDNDVSIAHSVTVMSVNHKFDAPDIPIKDQGIDLQPVHIQNNVWIGAKATILAGVTVGEGSIVAAGAVVNKNTEKNYIVGGVPAKVIKSRIK